MTPRESWSFYHFDRHCYECRQCYDPYAVYKRTAYLCAKGEALARDMATLVHMRNGFIYETLPDRYAEPDRVEVPYGYYRFAKGQLRVFEKKAHHQHRRRRSHKPIVELEQDLDQLNLEERRREDRYYAERLREDALRSEKGYEKARSQSHPHPSERAEIIVNHTPRSTEQEDEKSKRRRHRHSADYRREEEKLGRREKEYHHEEKLDGKEKAYRFEERYPKEKRHRRVENVDVEIVTNGGEKKYRTEIRKPDKHTKGYHY